MEELVNFQYIRRNPDEAYKLAASLEHPANIDLTYNQVRSKLWPEIDYCRDSLQEIHKRLRLRDQIALK